MVKLFSTYPHLEDDLIAIRKMTLSDAPALGDSESSPRLTSMCSREDG